MGTLNKNNFIKSLKLPDGITAYRFNGMDRVHFKCYGVGFLVIDMKKDFYNLFSRAEYMRDIGVLRFELTDSYGPNPALLRDIPYEDTEVLFALINYILHGINSSSIKPIGINTPLRPKRRLRKADGTIQYVCGRCEESFVKAPRCPECGQLVKE